MGVSSQECIIDVLGFVKRCLSSSGWKGVLREIILVGDAGPVIAHRYRLNILYGKGGSGDLAEGIKSGR